MHHLYSKTTIWGLASLILLVSLLAYPTGTGQAVAAGGGTDDLSTQTNPLPGAPALQAGGVYHVTTGGSSGGNGSMERPWSLEHALRQPAQLQPGGTVFVHGGTYTGKFVASLKGTAEGRITIRAVPNERAIVTNKNDVVIDIAGCAYVDFWGLEIAGSATSRNSGANPSNYGIRVNQGIPSNDVRFINMIVRDVQAMGFGYWQSLTNTQIYGSLIYFNGTGKLDHGVYLHNVSGGKYLTDNIIFDNASHGIHGYAETAEKGLTDIIVQGNTVFNNGSIGGKLKRNILVGGLTPTIRAVVTNNYTYYPGSSGQSLNLGYSAGSNSSQVMNNYLAGGEFEIGGGAAGLVMAGNETYALGGLKGFDPSAHGASSWSTQKPGGVRIFVRPNAFEPNRANITIYNWDHAGVVAVGAEHLGGVQLQPGQQYELHNAQDFFGDVITGVYDGHAINVPMTGHSVAEPVGKGRPDSTFPEFGAFVLIAK